MATDFLIDIYIFYRYRFGTVKHSRFVTVAISSSAKLGSNPRHLCFAPPSAAPATTPGRTCISQPAPRGTSPSQDACSLVPSPSRYKFASQSTSCYVQIVKSAWESQSPSWHAIENASRPASSPPAAAPATTLGLIPRPAVQAPAKQGRRD
jgi:hypothetical protein